MLGKTPKLSLSLSIIWLLLISWVAFFYHLGSIGLIDKTEPMFVEAARNMLVTGDWITPYWNGETRFDKPPLIYWLIAIAFKTFGINELAARIPSALMAIAMTILSFWTLLNYGFSRPVTPKLLLPKDRKLWISAVIGSSIVVFNPSVIAWGRTGVSDMLLAGCMSIALLAFFLGYAQEDEQEAIETKTFILPNRWYCAFYIFTAFAVLAKGPVGLVLPVLIIAAFLIYIGKFKAVIQEMKIVVGSLIFIAIALPWFVLVTLANGSTYLQVFFGFHNIQRFTSVVDDHPGPIYYYLLVILVGFLPWSIYLPLAIARLRFWARSRWCNSPRSTHLGLFALFWFAIIFFFFSISTTKLPSYVLPLMPAAAMMVTLLWTDTIDKTQTKIDRDRGVKICSAINVLLLFLLAVASFLSPQFISDPGMSEAPEVLQRSGVPLLAAIIWATAAIVSLSLKFSRKQWRWLWSVNIAAFIAFIIVVVPPAGRSIDSQRQLPLREIATSIVKAQKPQEEIVMVGFMRPSVVFYSQRNIKFYSSPKKLVDRLQNSADFQDRDAKTILLLSRPKFLQKLDLQPQDYQLITQKGAYELVRVAKERIIK